MGELGSEVKRQAGDRLWREGFVCSDEEKPTKGFNQDSSERFLFWFIPCWEL